MTRLEFLRRKKGLSQGALGREILYSRWAITTLETKRPAPDSVNVRLKAALENYFNEPLSILLQPVGDLPITEDLAASAALCDKEG